MPLEKGTGSYSDLTLKLLLTVRTPPPMLPAFHQRPGPLLKKRLKIGAIP